MPARSTPFLRRECLCSSSCHRSGRESEQRESTQTRVACARLTSMAHAVYSATSPPSSNHCSCGSPTLPTTFWRKPAKFLSALLVFAAVESATGAPGRFSWMGDCAHDANAFGGGWGWGEGAMSKWRVCGD